MAKHQRHPSKKHPAHFIEKLEIYAFWTGFASTLISLMQVLLIALKH